LRVKHGWLRILFAGMLAMASWGVTAQQTFTAPEPTVAPAWKLRTPAGETVEFPAAAQGRPTVLLFWPSWCPFSRALQPYVQDIWNDYRAAGVNVWTINIKETGDPVQAMKDRGLSFPLLLNGDPLVPEYGISRTPWLVVIDGGNRIVYTRPPNPPTPIDTAKAVRETLNKLLGDKAVPLPTSYPKPYDLHLKKASDLNQKLVPKPIAQSEWSPWLTAYLAAIPPTEARADLPARGAIPDGKTAIAQAREVWTQAFGAELTENEAPYRAYRKDNRWVVVASGETGRLGDGLILVLEAESGKIVRVAPNDGKTPAP
jgi:thiol-disulfide isomerase/thioredoxin